jgi:hypothetical protein
VTNIFSAIIKDMETFASKCEKFLQEAEGKAPEIERIAASALLVIGPLLQTVVTMTAGAPTGALVGSVISQVQVKLAAVSQLTTAVGTSGSISDLLAGITSDLSGLDSIAAIKDPNAQANLALVLKDMTALLAAFQTTAPNPPVIDAVLTPTPAPAPVADPTAADSSVPQPGPGAHVVVPA